jgi:hypothetical protein
MGCRRLDLRCRAEHVFVRIDVLAAAEASEDLRAAVANSLRADIKEVTTLGSQCDADISES